MLSGRVDLAELLAANGAMYEALPADPPRFALFDLTDVASLELTAKDMRQVVAQDHAVAARFPELLTVIVAPAAHNYGVARQWQILMELSEPVAAEIVHSREEARAALERRGLTF